MEPALPLPPSVVVWSSEQQPDRLSGLGASSPWGLPRLLGPVMHPPLPAPFLFHIRVEGSLLWNLRTREVYPFPGSPRLNFEPWLDRRKAEKVGQGNKEVRLVVQPPTC